MTTKLKFFLTGEKNPNAFVVTIYCEKCGVFPGFQPKTLV